MRISDWPGDRSNCTDAMRPAIGTDVSPPGFRLESLAPTTPPAVYA